MAVAAAIIAGGRALRLGGVAKPFIEVGGRTIAARQLEVLRPMFRRVVAVVAGGADGAPWSALGVEVLADAADGGGPLAGVAAALAAVPPEDAVVCVAGDLPFLAPALLAAVRDRAPGADAVAPRAGGVPQPLCARYAARLAGEARARIASGRLALHDLLAGRAVWVEGEDLRALDPGGEGLLNVNTAADLARAQAVARRERRTP
jgi:molybdopterin-guanine dinucleotide biosynthesis protein A